jgi:hypothetical protein
MGACARARALEGYTTDAVAERHERMYRAMLAEIS